MNRATPADAMYSTDCIQRTQPQSCAESSPRNSSGSLSGCAVAFATTGAAGAAA